METTYLTLDYFKAEKLVDFYSMQELSGVMKRHSIVWCWGAHNYANIEDKLFRFKVQGRLFKGLVWIGVNGLDLFNVYFSTGRRSENGCYKLVDKIENVYIEDLIETIDKKVETKS